MINPKVERKKTQKNINKDIFATYYSYYNIFTNEEGIRNKFKFYFYN